MTIRSRASELFGPTSPIAVQLCKALKASCRFTRTYAIPAGALSYDHSHSGDFVQVANGINWGASAGSMTATVPRPRDHAGGSVNVRLFFMFATDQAGTLAFAVTPMTYDSGNNFETYGSQATPTMNAPESLGSVYALSVTIEPGNGWGDGDWWFFRLSRQGTFPGAVRLMSMGVDYQAHL
ncbi:MAG: hypothetical protein ACOY0T_05940 [Myxococcota bacterium]